MAKAAYIGIDSVARKIKKMYFGISNARGLPSGYTQLSYIESTGTQYINTGISVPHASEKTIIEFAPMDVGNDNAIAGHAAPEWSWATNVSMVLNSNILVGNTTVPSVGLDTFCKFEYTSAYAKINDGTAVTLTIQSSTYTDGYNNTLFYASTKYGKHKVRSYKLYNGSTLVRDLVPCKNPSGTIGMYDMVNGVFYGNAGTGTFAAGATVGGIASKIKKMYIGVAGVARLFFKGGGELKYYGTATDLTYSAYGHTGATFGDLALFAGGMWGTAAATGTVNTYNTALTQGTAGSLSRGRCAMGAANTGNYIVFAGGIAGSSGNNTKPARDVDAYNTALTHTTLTELSRYGMGLAGTSIGGYALFAGGRYNAANVYANAYAYNSSLTLTSPTGLSKARNGCGATTVGNYALFGGGTDTASSSTSSVSAVVDVYNASLTRSVGTPLSSAYSLPAATTVGNYAIFLGGSKTTTDVYNSSLTKSMGPEVIQNEQMHGVTLENYALFGGGRYMLSYLANVIVMDESLTYNNSLALSVGRYYLGATTVGNYALFGGGMTSSSTKYKTVDTFILD